MCVDCVRGPGPNRQEKQTKHSDCICLFHKGQISKQQQVFSLHLQIVNVMISSRAETMQKFKNILPSL